MPEVILNIYRKGFIEAHNLANGWSRESITKLIQFYYKNGRDFKHAVRTYRGKHSVAKALTYCQQGKMRKFL